MMTWHKGPQSVEALMDSYNVAYMQDESRRRIDKRGPPEQWLQYLLNKGVTFHNFIEYDQYMDARIVTDRLENNPELVQEESETFGIPVSDLDRIKKRYLEHHLLFLKRKHAMEHTVNEPVTGGIHIGIRFCRFIKTEMLYMCNAKKIRLLQNFLAHRLMTSKGLTLCSEGLNQAELRLSTLMKWAINFQRNLPQLPAKRYEK